MAVDDLLDTLALQVASLGTRVGGHDDELTAITRSLEDVLEQLRLRDPSFYKAPWWFGRMVRAEAKEAIETITAWVDTDIIPMFDEETRSLTQEDRTGRVVRGHRLKECWFAHSQILQLFASLHWDFIRAHAEGPPPAYDTAPVAYMLDWVDRVLDKCAALQKECGSGCHQLGGKRPDQITWADRETWIKEFLASRPVSRG
jgi:hypothetical protein